MAKDRDRVKIATVTQPLGLYAHIPWCRTLCPYCDFAVHIKRGELPHHAYLEALTAELTARRAGFDGILQTIYFGGGTPSLWDPACIDEFISRVRARYDVTTTAEVTLEVNPIDCTPARLDAWLAAGINRLSIGIQALDLATLGFLERGPHHGDGLGAIHAARTAGFTNLSADFILGAGDNEALRSALAEVGPIVMHLSVYELTIEAGTRFGRRHARGLLPMAGDDALADTFVAVDRQLTKAGFNHYEISSYARAGWESRHNSSYWTGVPYLGLGVGASSLRVDRATGTAWRETNPRSTPDYLRSGGLGLTKEIQEISRDSFDRELLWLALRTAAGAPADHVSRYDGLEAWLLERGLAERREARVRPTLRGFLFANEIARRVLAAPRSRGIDGTGE